MTATLALILVQLAWFSSAVVLLLAIMHEKGHTLIMRLFYTFFLTGGLMCVLAAVHDFRAAS
jgi:hypothetical protein